MFFWYFVDRITVMNGNCAVMTWKWRLSTSGAATSRHISLVKLTGKLD